MNLELNFDKIPTASESAVRSNAASIPRDISDVKEIHMVLCKAIVYGNRKARINRRISKKVTDMLVSKGYEVKSIPTVDSLVQTEISW